MAKLHFKYASMNSGKSLDLIRTIHNYEENGFNVFVMKPLIDTKGADAIESRIGVRRVVDLLLDYNDDVLECLKGKLDDVVAIFVDEVQFLSSKQIDDLFLVSKAVDIPVICYGLRTSFQMKAFEGSNRLLEISDVLEEIPTLCKCGSIARFVARKLNGEYEIDGNTVVIDGTADYEYEPLCGNCYLEKVKKIDLDSYQKRLGR